MDQKNTNYQFKFSIVCAVYNTAPYLHEAIDSILSQDIDFQDSVQLILVDDGSTDDSGMICDSYQKKYPNNKMPEPPLHVMKESATPKDAMSILWILMIN